MDGLLEEFFGVFKTICPDDTTGFIFSPAGNMLDFVDILGNNSTRYNLHSDEHIVFILSMYLKI
jgi:hypothetical protein